MKKAPQTARIEETLRSSKLSAGGFLGDDTRPLQEIIDTDSASVARLGLDCAAVAARMREIGAAAGAGLGTYVQVAENLEACVTEARGVIVCPWPHPGRYRKSVVTVKRTDTGDSIRWSELSVHMVEEHGFFEGHGSPFRLLPEQLVRILF